MNAPAPARVVVAQDQPLVRLALRNSLPEKNCEVIGETCSAEQTMRVVAELRPRVLITEICLVNKLCLDMFAELRKKCPSLRILAVSRQSEDLFAERSIRAGCNGFVSSFGELEELDLALARVIRGEHYLSPRIEQRIVLRSMGQNATQGAANPLESLTDRELHVFLSLGDGMTVRQIAEQLELSVKTVESYRDRLKEKLGYHTTFELIRFALECRILGNDHAQNLLRSG